MAGWLEGLTVQKVDSLPLAGPGEHPVLAGKERHRLRFAVAPFAAGDSPGFARSRIGALPSGKWYYSMQPTTHLSQPESWVTLTNLALEQPVQLWQDTRVLPAP